MTNSVKSLFIAVFSAISLSAAADVTWYDGSNAVSYQVEGKAAPVVQQALRLFEGDMELVTGKKAVASKNAVIRIYELDMNSGAAGKLRKMGVPVDDIRGKLDAFYVGTHVGNVLVVGSNGRGCAYGILELSRMAGVSPWVWWGDVIPEKKSRLTLADGFSTLQSPSVEYRGIFINDEDWSLRNWAWKNYEKTDRFGAMGPKTYKAIFQLLLRLKFDLQFHQ